MSQHSRIMMKNLSSGICRKRAHISMRISKQMGKWSQCKTVLWWWNEFVARHTSPLKSESATLEWWAMPSKMVQMSIQSIEPSSDQTNSRMQYSQYRKMTPAHKWSAWRKIWIKENNWREVKKNSHKIRWKTRVLVLFLKRIHRWRPAWNRSVLLIALGLFAQFVAETREINWNDSLKKLIKIMTKISSNWLEWTAYRVHLLAVSIDHWYPIVDARRECHVKQWFVG